MAEEKETEFGIFWGDSIYQGQPSKEPIIEGFLYEKDVMCLSAEAKTGKSIFLQQLMFSLTTGKPFLGVFDVKKKYNVLLVQTEGDRCETIERIGQMKAGIPLDDERWFHCNLPGIALNKEKPFKTFMEMIRKPGVKYDVVILDPLYTTVEGGLLDQHVATEWIKNVRAIRAEFGCAIIVANHVGKDLVLEGVKTSRGDSDVFGSVFWAAFFNHYMKLKKSGSVFVLSTGKQRSAKIIDVIEMNLIEPNPLMFVLKEEDLSSSDSKIIGVLKMENRALNVRVLEVKSGLARATVYRTVRRLCDLGAIEKVDNNCYQLKKHSEEELL